MSYLSTQLAYAYESATPTGCYINGEPASCAATGGIIAAILIPLLLVGIVLAVFWFISLLHVIQHEDVPNRMIWIILHFVGLGPLAGVVHFFAVKLPYQKSHTPNVNNQTVAQDNSALDQPSEFQSPPDSKQDRNF